MIYKYYQNIHIFYDVWMSVSSIMADCNSPILSQIPSQFLRN